MTKLLFGMLAALVLLGGCATAGGGLAAALLGQLGPSAAALLGPEVTQVVTLLQGRGTMAVELGFAAKFNSTSAVDEASARKALAKAESRKKFLDALREGNDYSQFVQGLSIPARAALETARAATDAAYLMLLARLAEHIPEEVVPAAAAAV